MWRRGRNPLLFGRMNTVRETLCPRRRGLRQVPWLLALPGLVALFAFHFLPIGAF